MKVLKISIAKYTEQSDNLNQQAKIIKSISKGKCQKGSGILGGLIILKEKESVNQSSALLPLAQTQ